MLLPAGLAEREELQSHHTPLDCSGGVTVNTLRYSYFAVERGIFSPGTHLSATYLQRRAFLNPHCSYHLYPAEADVKHSEHNRGWHSRNSELEIK